nr:YetF domain-containing protein [Chryseobacterium sp. SNU WT5]
MVGSDPEILIKDGVIDNVKMKQQQVSFDELEEAVREHGVEKMEQVRLAVLEVDGNISIVSMDKESNSTSFTRHRRKFPRKSHKY